MLSACGTAQYRKHFLRLVDRGVTSKFKFIVMPIVGMSLDKIRREVLNGAQFSLVLSLLLELIWKNLYQVSVLSKKVR